jgi:hypothetical protein
MSKINPFHRVADTTVKGEKEKNMEPPKPVGKHAPNAQSYINPFHNV